MESKKKSPIASICILLFHLGLIYMVYETIAAEQKKPDAVQQEMQNDLP